MRYLILSSALACLLLTTAAPAQTTKTALSSELASFLDVKKSAFEKVTRQPLVTELDVPDRSRRIALAGLIQLKGSGAKLLDQLASAQAGTLLGPAQQDGFFSKPTSASNLKSLALPEGDFEVLADCEPSACKFKLDHEGIVKAQSIDWKNPTGQTQFTDYFREFLAQYVERYQEKGAPALIVYDDKPKPFALNLGSEMIREQMSLTQSQVPELFAYLGEYPKNRPEEVTDLFYWSLKDFGYRPTLSVDLIVVDRSPLASGIKSTVILQTIYADHYLAARYQIGMLLDGEKALGVPGEFLLLIDRVLFDDSLGGFKRRLLGSGMKDDLSDRLKSISEKTNP